MAINPLEAAQMARDKLREEADRAKQKAETAASALKSKAEDGLQSSLLIQALTWIATNLFGMEEDKAKGLARMFAGLFSDEEEEAAGQDGPASNERTARSGAIPSAQDMANAPRTLLDLIAGAEGVKHGYDTAFGNKEVPLTTMTVRNVIKWQEKSLDNGAMASPVGRYMIKQSTLAGLAEQMGVLDEKFTPELQDKMAVALMKGRGLDAFREGGITAAEFANNMAMEWSTLPLENGESYYKGDNVHDQAKVDRNIVLATLENDRTAYLGANDPEAVAINGVPVISRYSRDLPYGVAATEGKRGFDSIVMHVSGKPTVEESIAYSQTQDPNRGGYFGYHYLIGQDGTVVQTAPLSARTNHILPDKDLSFANSHSLGIALVGAAGGATEQQKQAAATLVASLQQQFGIANNRVVGHGQVQTNRAHDLGPEDFHGVEGADVVAFIRQNQNVQVASAEQAAASSTAHQDQPQTGIAGLAQRTERLAERLGQTPDRNRELRDELLAGVAGIAGLKIVNPNEAATEMHDTPATPELPSLAATLVDRARRMPTPAPG